MANLDVQVTGMFGGVTIQFLSERARNLAASSGFCRRQ